MSTHGLLAPIFHEAAKSGLKITAGGLALVPGANVAAVDDSARKAPAVQFFEDIDWHAMAGKRVTAVRRDLMHPGTHLPILLEALIVRAKESVTLWLSKKSSELRDPCDAPLLHDMLWPERSPVNAILHFFPRFLLASIRSHDFSADCAAVPLFSTFSGRIPMQLLLSGYLLSMRRLGHLSEGLRA